MRLGISKNGEVLASIKVKPTFIEEIKANQFEDEDLNKLGNKVVFGKTQDAIHNQLGVLNLRRMICVPRVDDLIHNVLAESYGS